MVAIDTALAAALHSTTRMRTASSRSCWRSCCTRRRCWRAASSWPTTRPSTSACTRSSRTCWTSRRTSQPSRNPRTTRQRCAASAQWQPSAIEIPASLSDFLVHFAAMTIWLASVWRPHAPSPRGTPTSHISQGGAPRGTCVQNYGMSSAAEARSRCAGKSR